MFFYGGHFLKNIFHSRSPEILSPIFPLKLIYDGKKILKTNMEKVPNTDGIDITHALQCQSQMKKTKLSNIISTRPF